MIKKIIGKTPYYSITLDGVELLSLTKLGLLDTIIAFREIYRGKK